MQDRDLTYNFHSLYFQAMKERLILTPINPFTTRQGEVLEFLVNGHTFKQIVNELGISPHTIKNIVYGYGEADINLRVRSGIFGVIEALTGYRPHHRRELAGLLEEDILLRQIITPHQNTPWLNSSISRRNTLSLADFLLPRLRKVPVY